MFNALARAIATAKAQAVPDGVGVRVSNRSFYQPDALVYCGPKYPGQSLMVDNPVIVVEVISPSSGDRAFSDKMLGYFQVPSVMHYLLVQPYNHYQRAEKDAPLARIHRGVEIRLQPPGIVVTLAEMLPEE